MALVTLAVCQFTSSPVYHIATIRPSSPSDGSFESDDLIKCASELCLTFVHARVLKSGEQTLTFEYQLDPIGLDWFFRTF